MIIQLYGEAGTTNTLDGDMLAVIRLKKIRIAWAKKENKRHWQLN